MMRVSSGHDLTGAGAMSASDDYPLDDGSGFASGSDADPGGSHGSGSGIPVPGPSTTPLAHPSAAGSAGQLPIKAPSPLVAAQIAQIARQAAGAGWRPRSGLFSAGVPATAVTHSYDQLPCGPALLTSPEVLRRFASGGFGYVPASGVAGLLNFEDFVVWSLAQADRMRTTSAELWTRLLDVDGDGVVGRADIEHAAGEAAAEAERLFAPACAHRAMRLRPQTAVQLCAALRGREGACGAGGSHGDVALTASTFRRQGCGSAGWQVFEALLAVDGVVGSASALAGVEERLDSGVAASLPLLGPGPLPTERSPGRAASSGRTRLSPAGAVGFAAGQLGIAPPPALDIPSAGRRRHARPE